MIWITHSIRLVLPVSVVLAVLASSVAQAGSPTDACPRLIEMFTTTDLPVTDEASINRQPVYRKTKLRVYELDGIQRIESDLSKNLSADPKQSRRIVLQRIQQWDKKSRTQMQNAAIGLAKAMQYGIDRYPAIVFDGELAIYGVTDLHEALQRYQNWREDAK